MSRYCYIFQKKQEKDESHYFSMDFDNEGSLRSLFWPNGRSRVASMFKDIVVFDVTYKINKLRMPFVPFTGVNHQWPSI